MQPKFFEDCWCCCFVFLCCFLCFGLVLQACDESTECSPGHLDHFLAAAAAAARFNFHNGFFFLCCSWLFLCCRFGFLFLWSCSCLVLFLLDSGCHGNNYSNTSKRAASSLRLLEAGHMKIESVQVQGTQANTKHV